MHSPSQGNPHASVAATTEGNPLPPPESRRLETEPEHAGGADFGSSRNGGVLAEKLLPLGGEFVQLFTANQRRIYLYILALMPNPVDAEEVLQETNLILWSKFSQFQVGSSFRAWACQIAYFEVLKFRARRKREKLFFTDQFIERLANEAAAQADALEKRRLALVNCLAKLPAHDRELIQQRYSPGASGQSVAESLGRPINSIYQSLGRIRKVLMECVTRFLAAEAGA